MSELTCLDCGGTMSRGVCGKCGSRRIGTTDGLTGRELRCREREEEYQRDEEDCNEEMVDEDGLCEECNPRAEALKGCGE